MSDFFANSRNFTINGGSFSHVERDQHNYNYIGPTTIVRRKTKEHTELDEYYKVKRGAIYKLKELGCYTYPRQWDDEDRDSLKKGGLRADTTLCVARVLKEPGSTFTVVQYSGPEAREAFERDFKTLSRTLTLNVPQLYGYSQSAVPSLILYDELIPISHIMGNIGSLGAQYLRNSFFHLDCSDEELWMDPARGVICRGPPGPNPNLGWAGIVMDKLPLSAELIQEDVLTRFFAGCKSRKINRGVVGAICWNHWQFYTGPQVSQPTVILSSADSPIAVSNNAWTSPRIGCLSGRKLLENGLTRFTLGDGFEINLWWNTGSLSGDWLSRAWSIFHARGLSPEEDLCDYELLLPVGLDLVGNITNSASTGDQRSQQPIYIFVDSPSIDGDYCDRGSAATARIDYYWSFEEDGDSPLSPEACLGLGLPKNLKIKVQPSTKWSWSLGDYRRIHQYQVLQGFDPATTDFAHHTGYDRAIFRPLDVLDRLMEVPATETPHELESPTLTRADSQIPKTEASNTPAQFSSFWSSLISPFSSTISDYSDILTIGF